MPPPASADDERLLALLERAFAHHAGADADATIDPAELQKALGLRSEYLAKRVFAAFDTNGDGVIEKAEFLAGVRALVLGSDTDKLRFAFRVHDHDGDGALSRGELVRMIWMSLGESEIAERATQPAEQLANALFAAADTNHDGKISFDELAAVARARPEVLRRMTRSEAVWIAPNEDLLAWIDERAAGGAAAAPSADPTWSRQGGIAPVVVLVAWAVANVAVFVVSLLRAHDASEAMRMGRAFGACAAFDGALVLVPVMRRLLTRVRRAAVGRALPIDDAVLFHRIVGHSLFALACAHVTAFAVAWAQGHAHSPLAAMFFTTSRGLTGTALLAVFAVMWSFALGFVRRSRRFELFYFTHLLYVVWLGVVIAHAPSFLAWAGVVLLGFVVEQLLRLRRRRPASQVTSSRPLRSAVTRLEIARPAGFEAAPGDYAFVRVPAVARHEWHPFTISSAPERDTLTFHVRALGNWSSALRARVEAHPDDPDLVAYVDGPYGSPSAHIFRSKHAVLIGGGIGVTPFASVLESLVLRANGASTRPCELERAHFFWVNRDQYSFEWFAELLRDLEALDKRGLLDIHLCMTGGRAGATSLGLELAREVMHAAGRSDMITGLRTHTHLGPPDWNALLGRIRERHSDDRIDVFFCGPPGLGKKIAPICARLGMTFREEKF